ncbi:hypothetical protein ACQPXB_21160 [Amycolatopsis sp. CA-161197]|uniref:hypothetical protein n=1 Tax=Amycolatopsis sp. CA-161197 TaxID=3239922 RepID=UPI003D8E9937
MNKRSSRSPSFRALARHKPGRRVLAATRRRRVPPRAHHTKAAMRRHILTAARDLLPAIGSPTVTLDEIAASAGITLRQLHTYYTSITAIQHDLHTDDKEA